MHANKREELESAQAGLIVAIPGLKQVRTGDTLCDEKKPVLLENLIFPVQPETSHLLGSKFQTRSSDFRI